MVGVVYQKEVTFEELEVEREVKEFCQGQGAKVTELWGSTLFHRQDIPYKNADSIPNTYTQFRKVIQYINPVDSFEINWISGGGIARQGETSH